MIDIDELCLVHYCHPSCVPFMNICRLPKEEAFSTAYKMAAENPETTAFYRFADFENYYPRRMKTDEVLYDMFVSLGGKPKERHPLSFVLQGSEYLDGWFGNGTIWTFKLRDIPSDCISFTLGDSNATLRKSGELTMYTKEMLLDAVKGHEGAIDDFMREIAEKYTYIEAQLWNDAYCTAHA
ncbi:MAG: hypothetical protein LBI19_04765 [Oscillospiraceae bacterium]|jgi:hypothetical protein|nr:hypothetical protein [Oscillospiraceae bacterium]